jgi:hypothetical protein
LRSLLKVAGIAAFAFLFLAITPISFAKQPTSQTYSLSVSVRGSWYQDPSFHCPGQCMANDRFFATGTLTYYNSTVSTTMDVTVNGTAHSFWGGVNANHPCTTITAEMQVNTAGHDKIHITVNGSDCETFFHGRYTGRNTYIEDYSITSGNGLFSEASGSGTVGGYGYPGAQMWLANANGMITFVSHSNGDQ